MHFSLGSALADTPDPKAAAFHLRYAAALKPEWAEVHDKLAQSLMALEQWDEATRELQEAVRLKPDQPEFHQRLALIQLQRKNTSAAIQHYRAALDLNPNFTPALNSLAWLLATHPDTRFRNGREALQLAQEAAELDNRKNPLFETTLATALAEVGRFDDAVATAINTIELAQTTGKSELAAVNQKLLGLYRSRQAYHQESDFKELPGR